MIFKKKYNSLTEKNTIRFRKHIVHSNEVDEKINDFLINRYEKFIVDCFEKFKNEDKIKTFEEFKNKLDDTNYNVLFNEYPSLKNEIKKTITKIDSNIHYLLDNYKKDYISLKDIFSFVSQNQIKSLNFGLGDFHNGQSTCLLEIGKDNKIIFKPTDGKITQAYHNFLDYINEFLPLGKYKYDTICKKNYHWSEFIKYKNLEEIEELNLYYERVGYVLCITYLLNSTDFHHENLIVNACSPILIDHETIIQAKINKKIEVFFKSFDNGLNDTVINTMLLPNHSRTNSNMPLGSCGIGYHKETEIRTLQKKSINKFTDNWQFVPRFTTISLEKENIPRLNGKNHYAINYINEILIGFEKAYIYFLENKDFFLNDINSPIKKFNNLKIRFIWRPTNVYSKILESTNNPNNLKDNVEYEKQIRDYLTVAFKNVPSNSNLNLILEHEIKQLKNIDIPYFELDSSSRDLPTSFGTIKNFFEFSAVENIERKFQKLSIIDLEFQKNLIKKSILK